MEMFLEKSTRSDKTFNKQRGVSEIVVGVTESQFTRLKLIYLLICKTYPHQSGILPGDFQDSTATR